VTSLLTAAKEIRGGAAVHRLSIPYFKLSLSFPELPINSTILSKNASHVTHLLHFLGLSVGDDSQWKLCYRASLHGWDAFTFHSRCDGKKNTVRIIENAFQNNLCFSKIGLFIVDMYILAAFFFSLK